MKELTPEDVVDYEAALRFTHAYLNGLWDWENGAIASLIRMGLIVMFLLYHFPLTIYYLWSKRVIRSLSFRIGLFAGISGCLHFFARRDIQQVRGFLVSIVACLAKWEQDRKKLIFLWNVSGAPVYWIAMALATFIIGGIVLRTMMHPVTPVKAAVIFAVHFWVFKQFDVTKVSWTFLIRYIIMFTIPFSDMFDYVFTSVFAEYVPVWLQNILLPPMDDDEQDDVVEGE